MDRWKAHTTMTTNLISNPIIARVNDAVQMSARSARAHPSDPGQVVGSVFETVGVVPATLVGQPPPAPPARPAGRVPAWVGVVADGRGQVTVTVRGWLGRVGVARLRTTLAGVRAAGTPRVYLNLSGLSGWDPGLPRALAWAHIQLHGNGQGLILTGAPPRLCTEIGRAHHTLCLPLFRGPRPGEPAYRPETADQP